MGASKSPVRLIRAVFFESSFRCLLPMKLKSELFFDTLILVGVAFAIMTTPQAALSASAPATFAEVQSVVTQRCTVCHGAQ
ncbi:MAG: hypothetical protein ACD_10C00858G0001, partial [uncultured bacterium]